MVSPEIFSNKMFLMIIITCKVAKVVLICKSHKMTFFGIQNKEVMIQSLSLWKSFWRFFITWLNVLSQENNLLSSTSFEFVANKSILFIIFSMLFSILFNILFIKMLNK